MLQEVLFVFSTPLIFGAILYFFYRMKWFL